MSERILKALMQLFAIVAKIDVIEESDEIVAGIEANGITVEYVVFDDEGHGFRKKENEIDSNTYPPKKHAKNLIK